MELTKPTIVVIAYNRDAALKRLLKSIASADYSSVCTADKAEVCRDDCAEVCKADDKEVSIVNNRLESIENDIRLVISIDKSDNAEVARVADEFEWKYGQKLVIKHDKNLGLKAHVLSCGDMSAEYGSIIMLEDDLYVSKAFYNYSVKALEFSSNDKRIAGISLYNHLLNVHAREPFEAINDGYDNWYFQFASSWGQAFSKEQWDGFRKFMDKNDGKDIVANNVPVNVSSWSAKSWLKYYIKYMIDNDLYFMYPRVSLTTNFSEEGTHADSSSDDLQVALLIKDKKEWLFSTVDESKAKYDAFFENVELEKVLACDISKAVIDKPAGNSNDEEIDIDKMQPDTIKKSSSNGTIVVDLYGYKNATINLVDTKYLLTSAARPNKIIKKYGRHFRPLDANVIENLEGEDFFLYDLEKSDIAPKTDISKKLLYNYRAFKAKYGIDIILKRLRG